MGLQGKEIQKRTQKRLQRFSSFGASGKILFENEKLFFEFDEENTQTAPGQHLVLYYKNLVLGGGIIS